MKRSDWKSWSALTGLALSLTCGPVVAEVDSLPGQDRLSFPVSAPVLTSPVSPVGSALSATPSRLPDGEPAPLTASLKSLMHPGKEPATPADPMSTLDLSHPEANKKPLSRKEKKEQKLQLRESLEATPVLLEALKLKWSVEPLQAPTKETRHIGLNQMFHDTLTHSIPVRQAEAQIKDAEATAKDTHDLLFNPLSPFEPGPLKQAAESNTVAAKAHLETIRQQALLSSAKLYGSLTQAFLQKYLNYEALEQGRAQLKLEEGRFVSGETNRFDVTQTQMALIDRYSQYLEADNTFHTASMVLANQLNVSPDDLLVPEGVDLQAQAQSVQLLKLLPPRLNREQVLTMVKARPDNRELDARKEALQKLIKASIGQDKQRRKAELRQLELEAEKLNATARVMAEKAFTDYTLAQKAVEIAQQRTDVATHYLYQLQISHAAGFSSAKEVLDGQIELSKIKAAQIGAQVAYNLSQIQLLYEVGLLNEESIAHPQMEWVNAL